MKIQLTRWLILAVPVLGFADGLIDSYQSLLSLSHGLLSSICLLSGITMLSASIAQFKMHKDNPSEVKLKIPMTFLLVGSVLLALAHMPSPY